MSTASENYRTADRNVQQFYHNYAFQNCMQSRFYIYDCGLYAASSNAMQLMQQQSTFQNYTLGHFDKNLVEFITSDFWGPLMTTLPSSLYYDFAGWLIWSVFRYYEPLILQRDKFKVRRTYWTGQPKQRRNL